MPRAAKPPAASPDPRRDLVAQFQAVRAHTLTLVQDLSAEDLCVQAMPDASPGKWHLAHTSWFFEAIVLQTLHPTHVPMDSRWLSLFNSYYQALGPQHPRAKRGLLTRPDLDTVHRHRQHVDHAMVQLMQHHPEAEWAGLSWLTTLGMAHEAQHQELLLTDLLALFAGNPLLPSALPHQAMRAPSAAEPMHWVPVPEGVHAIGQDDTGFAFDHERPRHPVLLRAMAMASRPVSNAEFQEFIDDGGYRQPALWSSSGWEQVCAQGWRAPLYWLGDARAFTLQGPQSLEPHAPVCHISLHEAMAYAQWAGARLPTEAEWEVWRQSSTGDQGVGEVWEWTGSAFAPYPGYRPWTGALAEYNGKFMVDQAVLRGASWATPAWTRRTACRNFFPAQARWQFSGLRLARDA